MGDIIQFPTPRDTSDPLLQALAEGRAASDRLRASIGDRAPENVVEFPLDPLAMIALACRAEAAELLARVEARKNVVKLPMDPLTEIALAASRAADEFSRRAAQTRALIDSYRDLKGDPAS